MSKRIDREIPQPEVGEAPLLPQPEERPVERQSQRVVAALDRDADALAEITAFGERAACEFAASTRVAAVEPERKPEAIAEQQIHLAASQRLARGLGGLVGAHLGLGEQVA